MATTTTTSHHLPQHEVEPPPRTTLTTNLHHSSLKFLSSHDPSCVEANSRTPTIHHPKTILTYLNEPVRENLFLECQLLVLAFAIGMQDATSYPDYFCFASNQTGNTVLLAVGVSGIAPNAFSIRNVGVSLSLFIAGGWVAGHLGNVFGPRRRSWLLATSFVQTCMVWAAVALQFLAPIHKTGPVAFIVLSLLAFSSSAQVAMARSLKMTEITTAMATAAYVDLLIDPKLYSWKNRSRNRRVVFLFTLAAGSFAGAFCTRKVHSAFSLLVSAVLKTIASLGFFLSPKMEDEDVLEKKDVKLMMG
jgi:uncharacterized membrane protein YoaK (UPF0700 family)